MSSASSVADGPPDTSQRAVRDRDVTVTGGREMRPALPLPEEAGGFRSLVPLEHVPQALVQGDRDAKRRDLGPQLRQVGLLPGATLGLAEVELDGHVDTSQLGDAPDQINEGDRVASGQVDRVAVDGALGGQAESEGEVPGVEEVPDLPSAAPDDHGAASVQHLLHQ